MIAGAVMGMVHLETPQATCDVACTGARVTSYKVRGTEVLFAPPVWKQGGGSFSHGGIPICWPWFGKSGPEGSKGHGFAHSLAFEVRERTPSRVVLGARADEQTRALWPHDFELVYTIALEGEALTLRLETKNPSQEPFAFTSGFHPYFSVGESAQAVVKGLDGRSYCDARVSQVFDHVWTGDLAISEARDHVFASPNGSYTLVDGARQRTVSITASGNKHMVVWNPGADCEVKEPLGPGEIPCDAGRHFVCVEPATLWRDQAVTLAPGASHVLSARLTLHSALW